MNRLSSDLTADAYERIVAMLRSDKAGRLSELRGKPRVGVRGRVRIAPLVGGREVGRPVEVWVRDVSANGIGILHTRSMAAGAVFVALFTREDDEAAAMRVTYKVAHVHAVSKGLFTIGAVLVAVG